VATTNSPGRTTFTTPSDREIKVTRVFDAPRQLVFDAHTKPEHIQKWMLGPEGWGMPVCEVDLRPGGAWHFVWRAADGTEMAMRGSYKEIVPPAKVVTTESWGAEWPDTTNTLELSEKDGKTTLTVTILYPTKEARDAARNTGMTDGMTQTYERLAEYLQSMA
jgi:uncharacterized protein YndB with AHSA1/START domain